MKTVQLLFGKSGCEITLPDSAFIIETSPITALDNVAAEIDKALANPIGCEPLQAIVRKKSAKTAAITISDITRPVPNAEFLPQILNILNSCGIADENITIVVGTGMHRPSTTEEMLQMAGRESFDRVKIISHRADDPETLQKVPGAGASVCKAFASADIKIVTGLVEPHFMAGFSGGRKGICPALVDLKTVQRFHGYKTLSSPMANTGQIENNPCHEESLRIAKAVGVDFLFNVAITQDRKIAAIFCGDLEKAHDKACKQVAKWTTYYADAPFDMIITNGGGYPLDDTFYQSVKGQYIASEALKTGGTLMQISACGESVGSEAYTELMKKWSGNWEGFLQEISQTEQTQLDQWQFQMQCKVLKKTSVNRLLFACDNIDVETLKKLSVTPITGSGTAQQRLQAAINDYVSKNPTARIAAIPDGPYTMVKLQD